MTAKNILGVVLMMSAGLSCIALKKMKLTNAVEKDLKFGMDMNLVIESMSMEVIRRTEQIKIANFPLLDT